MTLFISYNAELAPIQYRISMYLMLKMAPISVWSNRGIYHVCITLMYLNVRNVLRIFIKQCLFVWYDILIWFNHTRAILYTKNNTLTWIKCKFSILEVECTHKNNISHENAPNSNISEWGWPLFLRYMLGYVWNGIMCVLQGQGSTADEPSTYCSLHH